jgi:hypothetical protein
MKWVPAETGRPARAGKLPRTMRAAVVLVVLAVSGCAPESSGAAAAAQEFRRAAAAGTPPPHAPCSARKHVRKPRRPAPARTSWRRCSCPPLAQICGQHATAGTQWSNSKMTPSS